MPKKFLFLSICSSYSHSSLALPILHSAAHDVPDWEWFSKEYTVAEDRAMIAAELAELQVDLVGVSLYIFNIEAVLDILNRFHRLCPSAKIVVGGPECAGTGAKKIFAEYLFIHTVFCGEAEGLFADYLRNFDERTERAVLPADGRAIFEKWTEILPVNDIFFNASKAFVQVETSRGCPMGCRYCTSCNIPLRLKELDVVETELSLLHGKGVKEVRLLDRTFNFPQERGAALLRLFREKFSDIEFHLEIHPHFLNDEMKAELAVAPNLHIEAGVQSFDEKVQRSIGRNSRKSDVLDGLKFLASCNNFETHVDLICGLPEQTMDSIFYDVAELIGLNVDEIQLETLKILHGTPFAENAEKLHLIYSPLPPYDVMQTETLAADEIIYCRKLSRMLDLFYNHASLRKVVRLLALSDGGKVRQMLDFMLAQGLGLKSLFDLKKRVIMLADYLKKYPNDRAAFELAEVWCAQGYPMNTVPFGKICRAENFSVENLSAEQRNIINHRESKIWRLEYRDFSVCFVVNRHFKLNGALFFFA